jgi:hypothetical protein
VNEYQPLDSVEPGAGEGDLAAQLVAVARQQGAMAERLAAAGRKLDAQEARLAEFERTAARRVEALAAENADLRETLVLANNVLREIRAVCARHGWSEAAGPSALTWLEHVLSIAAEGWPSVN